MFKWLLSRPKSQDDRSKRDAEEALLTVFKETGLVNSDPEKETFRSDVDGKRVKGEVGVEAEEAADFSSLLNSALALAPFMKGLLGNDVGFYVSDNERYLYCEHGKVQLSLKSGDLIKEGSITARALKTGSRTVGRVGKEVYGVPYIGISYPLTEKGSGKVVGTVGMVTPIERQEQLAEMAGIMETQVSNISSVTLNLSATAEELAANAENLNSSAQVLRERVDKTDTMARFINEVAERTHLLGLNAAIEAARVGEAGRGFNVVAEEIRKLSQDTRGSVKEIMQVLQEMKTSILELVQAVEQISAVTQEQAASTEEISAAINELNELAGRLRQHAAELLQ